MKDNGLTKEDWGGLCSVFRKYSVVSRVILFGSRAKGNFRPYSDVDLAFFGQGLTIDTIYAISVDIDDLLLPFQFDLLIFDEIRNENLREHILRVGETVYLKDEPENLITSSVKVADEGI